jgi:hypothetical protein
MQLELQIAGSVDEYENKANEEKKRLNMRKIRRHATEKEVCLSICIWYQCDLSRDCNRIG